jgi:hypothetical protein
MVWRSDRKLAGHFEQLIVQVASTKVVYESGLIEWAGVS